MHCCNINKSRRGGFFFGSPGTTGRSVCSTENSQGTTVDSVWLRRWHGGVWCALSFSLD